MTKKFKNLFKARNNGKKKDLRVRESDGKPMQKNKVFMPNGVELKKAILTMYIIPLLQCIPKVLRFIIPFVHVLLTGMKRGMAKYVSRRIISHQVKAERNKSFGIM